jgi:RNase P/RNase MRP subunit p29
MTAAMLLASRVPLDDLYGRKVRVLREFADVFAGDEGRIVETYKIGKDHEGVMVLWDRTQITDGFGRQKGEFDELQWLEVILE